MVSTGVSTNEVNALLNNSINKMFKFLKIREKKEKEGGTVILLNTESLKIN